MGWSATQGELLKSATKAAKSWDDANAIAKVEDLRQARQQILSEKEGEQWVTKPKCDSWLSVTPKNDPVDLRCACGAFRLNLREK